MNSRGDQEAAQWSRDTVRLVHREGFGFVSRALCEHGGCVHAHHPGLAEGSWHKNPTGVSVSLCVCLMEKINKINLGEKKRPAAMIKKKKSPGIDPKEMKEDM